MPDRLPMISGPTSSSDGCQCAVSVRRSLSTGLVLLIVTGSLALILPATPAAASGEIAQYITGLDYPIALGFASDGRIFYAERNTGSIRIIQGGVLLPTPFYTLTNTNTVGERGLLGLALDPAFPLSPLGKVLRLNTDGTAPSDNPYFGNATWNPLVYTYGHRNMFGLAFHPVTHRPYVTENGPNCNDEINLLPDLAGARRNFGWGPNANCSGTPPPPNDTNQDGPNPVLPIWYWRTTICPTNAAIYGGPYFPAFRGDLFMGDCNTWTFHRLHLVPPNYDTVDLDTPVWVAPAPILDVEVGPDGAIWITTPSTIYRYWDSGKPPVPSGTATADRPVHGDANARRSRGGRDLQRIELHRSRRHDRFLRVGFWGLVARGQRRDEDACVRVGRNLLGHLERHRRFESLVEGHPSGRRAEPRASDRFE